MNEAPGMYWDFSGDAVGQFSDAVVLDPSLGQVRSGDVVGT
jgi:hypothetical protein